MAKATDSNSEITTVAISRYWIAATADGRRALCLQAPDGATIALELSHEVIRTLAADLAKLAALTTPPKTPNA